MIVNYDQWVAGGRQFQLAAPIADTAATLRRYGYPVGTIGDRSHFDAPVKEDHTICSQTGWPGPSPFGYVFAEDVMAPPPGSGLPSLAQLAAQMIADKLAGHPGMGWLKYQNWTTAGGTCLHDSFEPGHQQRPSSDTGHIHQSCRTDYQFSRCAKDYDPVARVRAGGGIIPVVYPTPAPEGYPAFPGRILIARPGAAMMHGTDVTTWQQRMRGRDWRLDVDGWYFTESAGVCGRFQADSTAHGWPLDRDQKVGPNTWRAAFLRPVSR